MTCQSLLRSWGLCSHCMQYFIVPCGKFESPYLNRAQEPREQRYPFLSYQRVQYFRVSKQWYGCQRLGFLTCWQVLMHAIVHGSCRNTVSLWWKATLGEKSLAAPGARTHVSVAPGFSVGCSTNWAVPTPSGIMLGIWLIVLMTLSGLKLWERKLSQVWWCQQCQQIISDCPETRTSGLIQQTLCSVTW